MNKRAARVRYVPALVAVLGIATMGLSSCKKKEEDLPPPPPSAAPAPPPAPTPVAIAPEEDAAVEIPGIDAATKHASKPADVAGLRACCTALRQNAASMPPPNNTYALQAATMCDSLIQAIAAGGTSKTSALGTINSIMKGANLPPACK